LTITDAGVFLVVWLQIKNKFFSTPFLDKSSLQYSTTAAQVKDQMTKMLQNEEGFISARIRKFRYVKLAILLLFIFLFSVGGCFFDLYSSKRLTLALRTPRE